MFDGNSGTDLLKELRSLNKVVTTRGANTQKRVDDLEKCINELIVGQRRPGNDSYPGGHDLERKSAIQMCIDSLLGLPNASKE